MKTKSIESLLFSLGIRQNLKGYRYLVYGLSLCLEDVAYVTNPYKLLYPAISCHFNVSRDAVEHAIRTAVKNCWTYGNQALTKLSGFPLKEKPASKEFIAIVYFHLNKMED